MELKNLNKNHGVIISKLLPTDWLAGAESGITYQEVQSDAQWDKFLPTGERQKNSSFDYLACVSFSALNCIEILMNRKMEYREFGADNLKWLQENGYVDENGKFNFSDRFTAKMSGTTQLGNYLGAVGDSIRNQGVVPEADWKTSDDLDTWAKYYAEIPDDVKAKGLEFVKRFLVQYEFILTGTPDLGLLKTHLKQSPLQLATATCSPWNTDQIIAGCGIATNHGTVLYGFTSEYLKDFDTYNPWSKKFALDYGIAWAMKYVIAEQKAETPLPTKFDYDFKNIIKFGEKSADVIALQKLLKILGFFSEAVNITGYYGSITQKAVYDFCVKNKVASNQELAYVNGRWCGKKTLAKLNEVIKTI